MPHRDFHSHKQVKFSETGITFSSKRNPEDDNWSYERKPRKPAECFSKKSISAFRALWRTIDFTDYLEPTVRASSGRGFFLTLNCTPDSFVGQVRFKRLKDAMNKALISEFGDDYQGVIWKAERQENGTPHLHLILFLAKRYESSVLDHWAKMTWCRLVGDGSDNFRRYGIDVQPLYGEVGNMVLRRYLERQPVREGQQWALGKVWGVWGRNKLPTVEPERVLLEEEQDYKQELLIEVLQEHPATRDVHKVQKLSCRWKGFSLDGLEPEVVDEIQAMLLEKLAAFEDMVSGW